MPNLRMPNIYTNSSSRESLKTTDNWNDDANSRYHKRTLVYKIH